MAGGWPGTSLCDECGTWYAVLSHCPKCGPKGKVKCPYSLGTDKHWWNCPACKGSGWVDEITG